MSLKTWFKEHFDMDSVGYRVPTYDNPIWENDGNTHILKINEILDGIENDRVNVRADMDILSKRISNAFEYVTAAIKEHEARFHTKVAPRKQTKRRTTKKLNELVETIRKA
jgi:Txe/YoeB family toxin of Txe-Axe toxin-antitoxin module